MLDPSAPAPAAPRAPGAAALPAPAHSVVERRSDQSGEVSLDRVRQEETDLLSDFITYALLHRVLPGDEGPVDGLRVEVEIRTAFQSHDRPTAFVDKTAETATDLRDVLVPHQPPLTTNRRQQAAAILIAIIALLTSLLQLLR